MVENNDLKQGHVKAGDIYFFYCDCDSVENSDFMEEQVKAGEINLVLTETETGLSPPVKYFTDRSKAVLLLWIF